MERVNDLLGIVCVENSQAFFIDACLLRPVNLPVLCAVNFVHLSSQILPRHPDAAVAKKGKGKGKGRARSRQTCASGGGVQNTNQWEEVSSALDELGFRGRYVLAAF